VFRLALSSGDWTTIASPAENGWNNIEWNDDGTAFYFVRYQNAGQNGVFRRSVEGGHEELLYALAPSALPTMGLEISPDRRWLGFQHTTEGNGGVFETQVIVVSTGSGERRIVTSLTSTGSDDAERLRFSGWSPDGRILVQHYPSRSLSADWRLVPLDGGPTESFSVPIPPATGTPPANQPLARWSPNGSAIAFVKTARSLRAFMLENPLAELPAARIGARRR
jgi:Tol biopolymer transport system component